MKLSIYKRSVTKLICTCMMASCVTVSSPITTYAYTANKAISVKAYDNHDNAYNKYKDTRRTKKVNFVLTKLIGVRPQSDINRPDDFTKVRCKIFRKDNGKYTAISNQLVLNEGTGWKKITLINGHLNVNYPFFGYIGNSPNFKANANVGMDAR